MIYNDSRAVPKVHTNHQWNNVFRPERIEGGRMLNPWAYFPQNIIGRLTSVLLIQTFMILKKKYQIE